MASPQQEARIAMRGARVQRALRDPVRRCAASLDLLPTHAESQHLTVIDYGCSQGGNSIPALKKILSSLPRDARATLHFEDTPHNDSTTLTRTLISNPPNLSTANRRYAS
ncbi:hypothetical protein BR93DRAFT_971936 [Coniochaeta sp. PMI_546]|nr:hypothetical protein BR93DRAFT_971936 [Coniochaeta sp. PMI_546]